MFTTFAEIVSETVGIPFSVLTIPESDDNDVLAVAKLASNPLTVEREALSADNTPLLNIALIALMLARIVGTSITIPFKACKL